MPDEVLLQSFSMPTFSPRLRWHCEPGRWQVDSESSRLRIEPDAKTDFWQRTHYGFEADNGHFLYLEARGDFVLSTEVRFHPAHQYDQAGLMVRVSPRCWLKTSVEFEPEGPNRLGAVVTNAQFSDWSTQSLTKSKTSLWFRVRGEGSDFIVEWSEDGNQWEQLRVAHLHDRESAASIACGLYACSPTASGYRAEFSFLQFTPGRLG